jgi:hypothetical protein
LDCHIQSMCAYRLVPLITKPKLRVTRISGIIGVGAPIFRDPPSGSHARRSHLSYISEFFQNIVDYFSDQNESAGASAALNEASIAGGCQFDSVGSGDPSESGAASASSDSASPPDFYDFSANSTATPFQVAAESSSITACTSTTEMFGSFDSGISSSSSWDSGSSWSGGSSFGGSSFD